MENLKGFPPDKMEKLNSLQNNISEVWLRRHAPAPSLLYHYTTADGFIGILNTASIWLTNLQYMNDLSELQYATDLITEALDSKSKEHKSNEVLKEFFQRTRNTFSPFEGGTEAFAICVCENGNLLSQWRAYGGRGGGYAIGLDFFHLVRFLPIRCFLRKVIYCREEQVQIINGVIDEICTLIGEMTKGQTAQQADSDNTLPQFCLFLNRILREYIFCFKHPEFTQEQEWRLVHVRSCNPVLDREADFADLKFRTFDGNVIPFIDMSLSNSVGASRQDSFGVSFPIQELVIGPTLNADLNRESATILLTKMNPDHIPIIRKSGIPLRWL